jgi:predicted ATPase/DNA-binding winged helix-turn-helix (wHTH) protein
LTTANIGALNDKRHLGVGLTETFRFGRFELRASERVLLMDGQHTALGVRAIDLLLLLIEHRERLVEKDELLRLVWRGLVVSEANLHTQISTLRSVLGQDAIATIPGRGYRFALPLDAASAAGTPPFAALGSPASEASTQRGILHFAPPSPDAGQVGIEFRPIERQVLVEGQRVVLGARAFDLLVVLVSRRGHVVSKNELLDLVWPGVFVEENNLQTQVSTLRKVLGSQAIATIPGRGYRFTLVPSGESESSTVAATEKPPEAVHGASTGQFKTNLPDRLPTLHGRNADLSALSEWVDRHPLVTIIGAGGIGKTQLARHLLDRHRRSYEHGVAWVELAGLSEPKLLAGAIAGALGVDVGSGDPLEGLISALKPLAMLLALDNAEHLIDEVARVVQGLIEHVPALQIVVTSQVPLRLTDERIYRVGSLALPAPEATPEEAMDCGAVALFVERARAADRRFVLTDANVAVVIDICSRLDGMALALELAAARVHSLGTAGLAAAIADRFRILAGGNRNAPQRQRTLRAALEWTHGFLNSAEQTVFRRLGAFAGGFTLEMARHVVADDFEAAALDEWVVADAIGTLVDRSLVSVDLGDVPRYELLESPRAFALEHLAEAGEQEACRRRQAETVLAHFASGYAECQKGRMTMDAAIAALEPDLDNAREALSWALKHAHHMAVALAPSLNFALTAARRQEADDLWQATSPLVTEALPASIRGAWALRHAYFLLGRHADSAIWARISIELHRSLGDHIGLYLSFGTLAGSNFVGGFEEREQALRALKALERPQWPPHIRLFGTEAEYAMQYAAGRFEEATDAGRRLLGLTQQAGYSQGVHDATMNLIDLEMARHEVDAAVRNGVEHEAALSKSRHLQALAQTRLNLTGALLAQDDLPRARAMAQACWPSAGQFGLRFAWGDLLALIAAMERRSRSAARLSGYSDKEYAKLGMIRQINERRAAERADRLARGAIGDDAYCELRLHGSKLHDDDIAGIAFGQEDT